MFLTAAANDGDEPDPCLRQLTVKKNNYGPSGETIAIRWAKGRYVPVGGKGTFERAAEESKIEDAYMRLLKERISQNLNVSPNAKDHGPPSKLRQWILPDEPGGRQKTIQADFKCSRLNRAPLEAPLQRL